MPGRKPGTEKRRQGAGAKDGASELLELVVAYVKQETLDPVVRQLRSLGRGIAGAALLSMGTVLLGLGFLRALQAEFGGATGVVKSSPLVIVATRAARSSVETVLPVRSVANLSVVNLNRYGLGAHLSGDWSWVPYMGGALFCVAIAAFCATRIRRGA
jgi:hypothetical protein